MFAIDKRRVVLMDIWLKLQKAVLLSQRYVTKIIHFPNSPAADSFDS